MDSSKRREKSNRESNWGMREEYIREGGEGKVINKGRREYVREGAEGRVVRKPGRGKKETALPICTRENINYVIECITCKEEGKKIIYFGKSSRSGHERGIEHFRE